MILRAGRLVRHPRSHDSKRRRYWYNVLGTFSMAVCLVAYFTLVLHGPMFPRVETISSLESSSFAFRRATFDFDPATVCDQNLVGENVERHWKFINDTLGQNYPEERVSGGIFLYPRQATLLTALVRKISSSLPQHRNLTLCETGFGSGHSLAMFLDAAAPNHNIHVVSFDKFDRPYQLPLWNHFWNETKRWQGRSVSHFAGDSCKTVPAHLSSQKNVPGKIQCDVLHGSSMCGTDNIDLVEHAPCGVLLTTTAMGRLNDYKVYFGPRAQWRRLRDRGCISKPVCWEEAPLDVTRDFIFAKQGSSHQSKFCMAMTTGKCQVGSGNASSSSLESSCTTDIHQITSQLELDKLCPLYQVEAPK